MDPKLLWIFTNPSIFKGKKAIVLKTQTFNLKTGKLNPAKIVFEVKIDFDDIFKSGIYPEISYLYMEDR